MFQEAWRIAQGSVKVTLYYRLHPLYSGIVWHPGRCIIEKLYQQEHRNQPVSDSYEFVSQDVEQTEQLGRTLGQHLTGGDVICLSGDLGAGKTALARGIGAGWDAQESVTSPTFTLVHEHHRAHDSQTLYHIDCYRLVSASDARSIGLEDLLYGHDPVVLEWAENVQDWLPPERLWITLTFLDSTRRHIHVTATGGHYRALLAALRAMS